MQRSPHNPLLTRADIPDLGPHLRDVSSVFNPGAVRLPDGSTLLLLRVQNRGRETYLMTARGDGTRFEVTPRAVHLEGLERVAGRVHHVYDPRITALDGTYYIMVAMDIDDGCRLGLVRTDDFVNFAFLGVVSDDDNRNGVLFGEKLGGRYLRLDRPNLMQHTSGVATGAGICLSSSADLLHWRAEGQVLAGRFHYWDEYIGAGPPPLKTRDGWLLLYHGVATHLNQNLYQAGVALLDSADPRRVLARCRYNLLEPRLPYELTGQVPNVVFPSGWTADRVDADGCAPPEALLRIYYGAADTVVAMAETTVGRLLAACHEDGP